MASFTFERHHESSMKATWTKILSWPIWWVKHGYRARSRTVLKLSADILIIINNVISTINMLTGIYYPAYYSLVQESTGGGIPRPQGDVD